MREGAGQLFSGRAGSVPGRYLAFGSVQLCGRLPALPGGPGRPPLTGASRAETAPSGVGEGREPESIRGMGREHPRELLRSSGKCWAGTRPPMGELGLRREREEPVLSAL